MDRQRIVAGLITTTLLASLTVAGSGCGFFLTQGPPTAHEMMPSFSCTESNTGPILDVVMAGIYVIATANAASNSSYYYGYGEDRGAVVAAGVGVVGFFGASATVGFHKTSECRGALRQLAARQVQSPSVGTGGSGMVSPVQAVVVAPALDTVAVGASVQLAATAYGSAAAALVGRTFAWSSSNDAIASVSATGLVTAHAPGTVVIAARADMVVGTAAVVVAGSH
jgi:Big-like domain-containing protein